MTRCLSHLASTGLVAGAMATLPVGVGIGQNVKPPVFLDPGAQVRGAAGRLRSVLVAAAESDEQEETEESAGETKPGEEPEESVGGFGGVEQIGPDLTREEEEAAIEGGWDD